jgi:hypothetical protein
MKTTPLTDIDIDWEDPEAVFEIVFFRATTGDEEWADDPASLQWDLSREEAARRLDEEDYDSPF